MNYEPDTMPISLFEETVDISWMNAADVINAFTLTNKQIEILKEALEEDSNKAQRPGRKPNAQLRVIERKVCKADYSYQDTSSANRPINLVKLKRKCVMFSKEQINTLTEAYNVNKYLSSKRKILLANQLGLATYQISNWFYAMRNI